jgi:hypothetical protein
VHAFEAEPLNEDVPNPSQPQHLVSAPVLKEFVARGRNSRHPEWVSGKQNRIREQDDLQNVTVRPSSRDQPGLLMSKRHLGHGWLQSGHGC